MSELTHLLHHTLADKYRIDELIGKGGGATVFLATHIDIERAVAIKVLDPQWTNENTKKRFVQEAKIISQFKHPNTITIFDYGQHRDLLYLVMEYINGGSLNAYVKQYGAMTSHKVAHMTLGILGALEEAHHHGVLHRDLKPEKIMLAQNFKGEWMPRVVDFGIAKVLPRSERHQDDGSLTQENAFIGTPKYTAPEQILSEDISPASDLYNVGLLMWFMLTGQDPIDSKKVKDCLRAHLSKKPWVLPNHFDVPEALAAIVHRALLKDRRHRYASCREMIRDLKEWLDEPSAESTITLQHTKKVIYALIDEEDDDDWMFDQSHIIDPNVLHTSEWLGATASSFDLSEVVEAPSNLSSELPVFSEGTLDEVSAPVVQLDQKSIQEQSSPYWPSYQSSDLSVSSDELSASNYSSEFSVVSSTRPRRQTQQTQQTQAQKPSKKLLMASAIGVVVTIVVLAVVLTKNGTVQNVENHRLNDEQISVVSKDGSEKNNLTASTQKAKKKGKFTREGLLMVLRTQNWKLSRSSDEKDFTSFKQRLYLFYKKNAKLEVTIYDAKNANIVDQLLKQTQRPAKSLVFEHRVIRLNPLNKRAIKEMPSLEGIFQKYRTMVEGPKSKDHIAAP